MTQSLPTRLRETALRIQREESIHLGNLQRLLREAANALEDGGLDRQSVDQGPPPRPLDMEGVVLAPHRRGKLELRARPKLGPLR